MEGCNIARGNTEAGRFPLQLSHVMNRLFYSYLAGLPLPHTTMPAQRTRNVPDESKSEASSTREKYTGSFPSTAPPKKRRNVHSTGGSASNLREVVNASQSAGNAQQQSTDDAPRVGLSDTHHCLISLTQTDTQISWPSFDTSTLLTYKTAHRLDVPSAFTSPYNERMLSRPGIGSLSPTMARPKKLQRVGKDQLAMAVRKDFNAAMVSESEIITSFLYSVYNQGTHLFPFGSVELEFSERELC